MDAKPLMFLLKQTEKEWTEYLRKLAEEAGIPDAYRPVIMFLTHHPGASQKMIAEYRQITYAAVSRTVKEMLQEGYLTRETLAEDQRYAQLFLTEKGQACSDRMRDKIREADNKITAAVTPEKEAQMREILGCIREAIRKEL